MPPHWPWLGERAACCPLPAFPIGLGEAALPAPHSFRFHQICPSLYLSAAGVVGWQGRRGNGLEIGVVADLFRRKFPFPAEKSPPLPRFQGHLGVGSANQLPRQQPWWKDRLDGSDERNCASGAKPGRDPCRASGFTQPWPVRHIPWRREDDGSQSGNRCVIVPPPLPFSSLQDLPQAAAIRKFPA